MAYYRTCFISIISNNQYFSLTSRQKSLNMFFLKIFRIKFPPNIVSGKVFCNFSRMNLYDNIGLTASVYML